MSSDEADKNPERALAAPAAGDQAAGKDLLSVVYAELRALAGSLLKTERADHTLPPTALVHEAWLRLSSRPDSAWKDIAHFKAVAVRAMRHVLVDHARKRAADKRGGDWRRITLSGQAVSESCATVDVLDLERALVRLEALDERQARVVELRFLGGLTVPEAASVLGVDPSTVKADWAMARLFLAEELGRGDAGD